MPTYEYRCEACGNEFTTIESIREHEQSHPRCPKCNSDRVLRTLSSVHVKTSRKS